MEPRSGPSPIFADGDDISLEPPAELGRPTMMMSRSLDDQSLVEAFRAGRTDAFGVLVERHQERLYPTILRLTGSPEDAEDVLQDAFVRRLREARPVRGRELLLHMGLSHRGQPGDEPASSASHPIRPAAAGHSLDGLAEAAPRRRIDRVDPSAPSSGPNASDSWRPHSTAYHPSTGRSSS